MQVHVLAGIGHLHMDSGLLLKVWMFPKHLQVKELKYCNSTDSCLLCKDEILKIQFKRVIFGHFSVRKYLTLFFVGINLIVHIFLGSHLMVFVLT